MKKPDCETFSGTYTLATAKSLLAPRARKSLLAEAQPKKNRGTEKYLIWSRG